MPRPGLKDLSAVFIGTQGTAIALYTVLVVLPTFVFAGLHWLEIVKSHQKSVDRIPFQGGAAMDRVMVAIKTRATQLLSREDSHPWYYYQDEYYEPIAAGSEDGEPGDDAPIVFRPSPFVAEPPPVGILRHFAYDSREGVDAEIRTFGPLDHRSGRPHAASDAELRKLIEDLLEKDDEQFFLSEASRLSTSQGKITAGLPLVVVNLSPERNTDVLARDVARLKERAQVKLDVYKMAFNLRLVRGAADDPSSVVILATRSVSFSRFWWGSDPVPLSFEENGANGLLMQGFVIDLLWLLSEMPSEIASKTLDPSWWLSLGGVDGLETEGTMSFNLVHELNIIAQHDEDESLGEMAVVINLEDLERNWAVQTRKFMAVGGMMIISLALGMWLLIRRLQTSLESARRTENFVASITHELRTPIAAVKVLGENLRDGVTKGEVKQHDYYERIINEANRLDGLVDRVLQTRKLGAESPQAKIGNLNEVINMQMTDLKLSKGAIGGDLSFVLGEDLRPVYLLSEALHSILVNLVENARKFAPVDDEDPDAEPIQVCTRMLKNKVVLEVMDRGPGIPDSERTKVFDAFYRIGDERTRRTPGTGLGLHLVFLQAKAIRARVQVHERPGGGCLFRVTFRSA